MTTGGIPGWVSTSTLAWKNDNATSTFLSGISVGTGGLASSDGLTLSGGVLNASQVTGTSTFGGGLVISTGGIDINLESCTAALETDANGSIICGTDADTTYSAGKNLGLSGTTFTLDDTLYSMGDIFATTTGSSIYASSTVQATGNILGYASGLFGGTTTPWKGASLTIEQQGVGPLLAVGDTGTSAPFLYIDGHGNVGLGTTTPSRILKNVLAGTNLVVGKGTGDSSSRFIIESLTPTMFLVDTNNLATAGQRASAIQQDQNVLKIFGINDTGTLNSNAITRFNVANGQMEIGDGGGAFDGQLSVYQAGTGDIFNLFDEGSQVLTVLDGGRVGIGGTSTPILAGVGDTSFGGAAGTHSDVYISGGLGVGNATTADGALEVRGSANQSNSLFTVTNNGHVVISTSTPNHASTTALFHVGNKLVGNYTREESGSEFQGIGIGSNITCQLVPIGSNCVSMALEVGNVPLFSALQDSLINNIVQIATTSKGVFDQDGTARGGFVVGGYLGTTLDTYLSGGLGVGNATATDGILETSGLAYIGGIAKIKGTATSTISGGLYIASSGGGLRVADLNSCDVVATDANGGFVCSVDDVGGGSSNPNLVYQSFSGTKYFTASSTADNLAFRFDDGFVSSASSSIAGNLYVSGDYFLGGTTTQPLADFALGGGDNSTADAYISGGLGVGNATTSDGGFQVGDDFFVYSNGKIGVGTSSPRENIEIEINENGDGALILSNFSGGTSAAAAIAAQNNIGTNVTLGVTGSNYSNTDLANRGLLTVGDVGAGLTIAAGLSDDIRFATDGLLNERMRLDSSGNLGLATTSIWGGLSVDQLSGQGRLKPVFVVGDNGTSTPSIFVTQKGVIGFGTSAPTGLFLNPGDVAIGRNGASSDLFVSGGLGVGNATTTDGILETSGLAYIGGILKVKGSATSTFTGGVYADAFQTNLGACTGTGLLETDSLGAIYCNPTGDAGAGSSPWTTSGNIVYLSDTVDDYVGTGTSSPTLTGAGDLSIGGPSNALADLYVSGGLGVGNATTSNGDFVVGDDLYVYQNGRVGIGTSSPNALFSIGNNYAVNPHNIFSIATTTIGYSATTTLVQIGHAPGADYKSPDNIAIPLNTGLHIGLECKDRGFSATKCNLLSIETKGSAYSSNFFVGSQLYGTHLGVVVGIGTSTPALTEGTAGGFGIGVDTYIAGGLGVGNATTSNGDFVVGNNFYVYSNGRVGTGTSSPALAGQGALSVGGPNNATADVYISGGLGIGDATTSDGNISFGSVPGRSGNGKIYGAGTSTIAGLILNEHNAIPTLNGDGAIAVGSIGVGNTHGRLWVQSRGVTFKFGSNTNTADYSEFFYQGNENAQEGDIMSVSTEAPPANMSDHGGVKKSVSPYERALLGVVTNPNRGTNYNDPNYADTPNFDMTPYANVGLLGHIMTKVSTENGPIAAGDRITSSSIPGVGMKATKEGPYVGVALRPFDGTTGTTTTYTYYNEENGVSETREVNVDKILTFVQLGWNHLDAQFASASSTEPWVIDFDTGRVKTAYVLDMGGKSVENIKAISSASGKWSIDEDGNMIVKSIEADSVKTKELRVGESGGPSGVTLFDETNGAPYCIKVINGSVTTVAGSCIDNALQNPPPPPPAENPPPPPPDETPPAPDIPPPPAPEETPPPAEEPPVDDGLGGITQEPAPPVINEPPLT